MYRIHCIAAVAVAVAGGLLIFGGELNDFARWLMYVVLVASILLGLAQIVGLFGASGASIGTAEVPLPDGRRRGGRSWLRPALRSQARSFIGRCPGQTC